MSNIDEKIKDAFASDPDIAELGKRESLLQQSLGTFRGQDGWFNVVVVIVSLAFLGVMIWSAVSFFDAESTKMQIMWAVVFMFANTVVGMLKLWFWLCMNRNSVIREVKRLELQVAVLARENAK